MEKLKKCPNCGSSIVFTCTDKLKYPNKRYFECINCLYKSRQVDVYEFKCVNNKSEWEIELDKLEKEWQ